MPAPDPQPALTAVDRDVDRLRGLLDIAHAVRGGGDLRPLLEAIAQAVGDSLGFGAVVVNLHRPEWDDYEVVVVHGSEGARSQLLGQTTTREDWAPLLDSRFRRGDAYLIPHGEYDWDDGMAAYIPPASGDGGPDAWHPEDALMLPLRSSGGQLLGILSVDEPASGQRPSDAELEVLGAIVAHAAVAVEQAQATAEARRHRAAIEHLLRVSAQLTGRRSAGEMLEAVCGAIRDALGFQKVLVALPDALGDRRLVPWATVGWSEEELEGLPVVPVDALLALLGPEHDREGCALLERETAHALVPEPLRRMYSSVMNGSGPLAWRNHWLMVGLHDRDGVVNGIIWADDPADRLLPTTERLQALRAFANQAISAVDSARQLEHVSHLAAHDPLTGLRNRRDFEPRIDADISRLHPTGVVSLIVCDLDHFKRVNDSLGHEAGDQVLRRFSELLRRSTRGSDVPTRLGGEEFAIVLPGADGSAALAVAERLRLAVRQEFSDVEPAISVSAGVACSSEDVASAAELMRAANRSLYAAKRLGRDRCVLYHPETLALLDSLKAAEPEGQEQLAAAILLAETLDLRDGGTARHSQTVARLSEQVAAELAWTPERVERMRVAGLLHDIGKLGISDAILHKPGPLDDGEWAEMKRHPEVGARILEHSNLRDIAAWVLAHHERIDGRGYPLGLAGEAIPIEARVLAVADAYEAMTADRPYRKALPGEIAEAELRRHAGTQFDEQVVEALLRILGAIDASAPLLGP
ncbi:MAG TPA: diguanylate cyclase [Solirubrobacteraceae bacterium]|nr:diguanylate cyclase [Solirubrobacteraceae bacterium]